MNTQYRQVFLKDLKKLRGTVAYNKIFELAFTTLPNAANLQEISNIKVLKGASHRYRIRVGDYRIGIEILGNTAEFVRVLHRKDFYRYFP